MRPDFLCQCLSKEDLVETLLNVGMVDAFFDFCFAMEEIIPGR